MNGTHERQRLTPWRRVTLLLGILVTLLPLPADAGEKPAGRPLEKVAIAYSAISGNMAPAWVTYEAGFFRKHGLDVELIFVEGGSKAAQALLSGDVAVAQIAGASVLQSNLQGSGIVMIAGVLNTMNYQFMVAKGITQPDQLKGKSVAVSRYGSSSDFATRYALDKFGLVPEKDVAVLQIGSQPARFAALESGKVHGVMLEVPLTIKAKKMGFSVLADLQMLGLEYQHTGLATTQALIKSRPELVRNIMKAYVEGIHYYKTHRQESLAILAKYLKSDDPEALAETYEVVGLTLLPEKPYPTLRGIQIMLRELAEKEPKAQTAKPEQFVDMSFVKELDSSGFIDRLYKPAPAVATREEPRPAPARAPVAEKEKPKPAPVVASKPAPAPRARRSAQEYTVRAGDTLSRLAERTYGDPFKWEKIYAANSQTVKNPHYIFIGQKIVIPPDDGVGK